MPIDLAQVDWLYVLVLAVLVFIASGIGNLVVFASRGTAAILSAILFAAMFVAWTYYPHGLPLPTRLAERRGSRRRGAASPGCTGGAGGPGAAAHTRCATSPRRPVPPAKPVQSMRLSAFRRCESPCRNDISGA